MGEIMANKKVAVLTFFNRLNYGADLQAYALSNIVKQLGFECELLDVLSPNDPKAKRPQKNKSFLEKNKDTKSHTILKKSIARSLGGVIGKRHRKMKKDLFMKFKNDQLPLSSMKYSSVDELYEYPGDYDFYITGSDQVWSPLSQWSSPEPYFLTFAKKEKKKIAYAPSFGVEKIPASLFDDYKRWLSNIDCLSVREQQGATIIKDLSGRESEVVLDPTLLIQKEKWMNLAAGHPPKKPYILLYDRFQSSWTTSLARRIKNMTGWDIIRIPKDSIRVFPEVGISYQYEVGPSEFLRFLGDAAFIITTSFHGTAFAINFNIPFFSVIKASKKTNSRIISILQNTGLQGRLSEENIPLENKGILEVDFSRANVWLEESRKKSIAYLVDSLN
jgi:hypothetical protein